MPYDLAAALKIIAVGGKTAEVRGVLYLASDEVKRLQEIEVAVQDCVVANYGEKAAAWVRVKELCRVSGDK